MGHTKVNLSEPRREPPVPILIGALVRAKPTFLSAPRGSRFQTDARSGDLRLSINFTTNETSEPCQEPTAPTFTLEEMALDIGIHINVAQVHVSMLLETAYIKVGPGMYQLRDHDAIRDLVEGFERVQEHGIPIDIEEESLRRHLRLCKKYALTTTTTREEARKIETFISQFLQRREEMAAESLEAHAKQITNDEGEIRSKSAEISNEEMVKESKSQNIKVVANTDEEIVESNPESAERSETSNQEKEEDD